MDMMRRVCVLALLVGLLLARAALARDVQIAVDMQRDGRPVVAVGVGTPVRLVRLEVDLTCGGDIDLWRADDVSARSRTWDGETDIVDINGARVRMTLAQAPDDVLARVYGDRAYASFAIDGRLCLGKGAGAWRRWRYGLVGLERLHFSHAPTPRHAEDHARPDPADGGAVACVDGAGPHLCVFDAIHPDTHTPVRVCTAATGRNTRAPLPVWAWVWAHAGRVYAGGAINDTAAPSLTLETPPAGGTRVTLDSALLVLDDADDDTDTREYASLAVAPMPSGDLVLPRDMLRRYTLHYDALSRTLVFAPARVELALSPATANELLLVVFLFVRWAFGGVTVVARSRTADRPAGYEVKQTPAVIEVGTSALAVILLLALDTPAHAAADVYVLARALTAVAVAAAVVDIAVIVVSTTPAWRPRSFASIARLSTVRDIAFEATIFFTVWVVLLSGRAASIVSVLSVVAAFITLANLARQLGRAVYVGLATVSYKDEQDREQTYAAAWAASVWVYAVFVATIAIVVGTVYVRQILALSWGAHADVHAVANLAVVTTVVAYSFSLARTRPPAGTPPKTVNADVVERAKRLRGARARDE